MNAYERHYTSLRRRVDHRLRAIARGNKPHDLLEACRYVLAGGGKRVRSTLVLLACEAVGGDVRIAIDAGTAIELLHNFTLVHDDVMDNAPARRGRATVHTHWNVNSALLVGDTLLGFAYRQLLKTTTEELDRVCEVFTEALVEVCTGQALDLEFEQSADISVEEYFEMIEKKTARLLAASAEIGGILGGGTERQIASLRTFGRYLGRAFQVQDDLLDAVGNEATFGKAIGGDIIEGKKTFLLLKALEHARGKERAALMRVMYRQRHRPMRTKGERHREVRTVTAIFHATGALDAARASIRRDTRKAESALEELPKNHARDTLHWLSQMLLRRSV